MESSVRRAPIRFGVFEADLTSGELRKHGVRLKLQEKPFQALTALLERPGEVLTRDDLQKRLWPDGSYVDFDHGLNKAINRLREALGDNAETPRFIETLPQRGYRFIAPVDTPAPALAAPPQPERAPMQLDRRWLLAGMGGLGVVSIAYLARRSKPRRIESIAVLPLENLSSDPEREYFSDGMTDELIGELARIPSLRVISRTSVMQYKGKPRKSLPEIAHELRVDVIVEGTVTQVGNRVRILAQLIRAEDDRHLLSQKYERDLVDVLALQSEVARALAAQIHAELTPGGLTNVTRTRKIHPEAHEAYLKGVFFLHRGAAQIGRSIDFFQRAIQLDPSAAEAYAGFAEALVFGGIFGLRPSEESYPEARGAALRALELDPSSAASHNVLADVKKGYDWDLAAAEVEYKRALELNRSHLLTHLWYAECFTRMGRFDDAETMWRSAAALDPVSAQSYNNHALLLWRARRFDEAVSEAQHALDIDPHRANALWWQGLAYAGRRDFAKAIDSLRRAVNLGPGPMSLGYFGHVLGLAGERTKALDVLRDLAARQSRQYVSPVDFAVVHAGLGETDAVFQWLDKGCRSRAHRVHELRTPVFDGVRADPRFAGLLKRIGLVG